MSARRVGDLGLERFNRDERIVEGEQGRVVKLAPGGKTAFDLALEIHAKTAEVEQAEKAIAAIQGDTKPTVFDAPQKGWCAP